MKTIKDLKNSIGIEFRITESHLDGELTVIDNMEVVNPNEMRKKFDRGIVFIEELKQAAIEWIKEMNRVRDNKIGGDNICDSEMVLSEDDKGRKTTLCVIPYEQDDFHGAITIMEHFFGIKESDLG